MFAAIENLPRAQLGWSDQRVIPCEGLCGGVRVAANAKFDHADRFNTLSGERQSVRMHSVSVRLIGEKQCRARWGDTFREAMLNCVGKMHMHAWRTEIPFFAIDLRNCHC